MDIHNRINFAQVFPRKISEEPEEEKSDTESIKHHQLELKPKEESTKSIGNFKLNIEELKKPQQQDTEEIPHIPQPANELSPEKENIRGKYTLNKAKDFDLEGKVEFYNRNDNFKIIQLPESNRIHEPKSPILNPGSKEGH